MGYAPLFTLAFKSKVCPSLSDFSLAESEIELGIALTEISNETDSPPCEVQLIFALPALFAVIIPFESTEATAEFSLLYESVPRLPPSLEALICCDLPTAISELKETLNAA